MPETFYLCANQRSGLNRSFRLCLNFIIPYTEHKTIDEIASSHMARRTFIGNLYKHVKDPELVGALSGHKTGVKRLLDIGLLIRK